MFHLSKEDHVKVRKLIKTGKSAREINRAHCLNQRDRGLTTIEIAEFLEWTPRTVIEVCSTYMREGLERALKDDYRSGRPVEIDARIQSRIVALVCSDPPEGFDRWSLELLKATLEGDGTVERIGKESVRIVLREHDLKPWQQRMWCVGDLSDEYIERMEQVLDVYELPHDRQAPVVCIDEKPVVLRDDARARLPMAEGRRRRIDYEYVRKGTANVFCAVEPKAGVFFNKVTPTRCASEFALFLAEIASQYKGAKKITLVMDNLSTHTEKSLLNTFGDKEGSQLWKRFHVVYTPKHGSWLNQAEIAIGMYQRQCLGGSRIPDLETLTKKTAFWNRAVNTKNITIKWRFTKDDAREKFDYR